LLSSVISGGIVLDSHSVSSSLAAVTPCLVGSTTGSEGCSVGRTQLEADELALFHAGHLVDGISLGAWVGSRTEGVTNVETEYDYES
jgi:hypothetical protein